ncbi:MAG: glycosyl hydrolase family 18 protein [Planctomycetota bacterium]
MKALSPIRRAWIYTCLAGLLGPHDAPAAEPRRPEPGRTVSAWYVYSAGAAADTFAAVAGVLDEISVAGEPPPAAFVRDCQARGLAVYRLLGATNAYKTADQRRNTIRDLVASCTERGFDGLDIDPGILPDQDRAAYSLFVTDLARALHDGGKRLTFSVYAPVWGPPADPECWFDARVIAAVADRIRVMCYDMHMAWPEIWVLRHDPGFGPVSTPAWTRQSLEFWLRHAPREKLVLGLPAYSNDFVAAPGGKSRQVYADRPAVPVGRPVETRWLAYEQVHVHRYLDDEGQAHVFYASDARSTAALLRVADELGVSGVGFWHFAAVPPDSWTAVRDWKARAAGR